MTSSCSAYVALDAFSVADFTHDDSAKRHLLFAPRNRSVVLVLDAAHSLCNVRRQLRDSTLIIMNEAHIP